MLFKEMSVSDVSDPLYIPVSGMDKTPFYFQPATMEILRECPMVSAHHGGVLCEELGMWCYLDFRRCVGLLNGLIYRNRKDYNDIGLGISNDRPAFQTGGIHQ